MNSVFDTSAGPNLIWEDFLEGNWLKTVQANNGPSLQSATNQELNIVGTVTLPVRMADSRGRVVCDIVRNLAVPAILATLFIDRFLKGIFPHDRKIVLYNSKPVPILTINNRSEEQMKKEEVAKNLTMTKDEPAARLVRVARQPTIPSSSKRIGLVTTDAKGIVQIEALLQWTLPKHKW